MPRLSDSVNKTMFGYQVDKENDSVIYSDAEHVYLDKKDGSRYVSVTTLIENYTNEFNKEFFARYKALEALADPDKFSWVKQGLLNTQVWKPDLLKKFDIDETKFNEEVQAILDSWTKTNKEATDWGTKVHAEMEESFYGKSEFDFTKFGCPEIKGNYICNKGYYTLDIEHGVYPEYLISWISPDGVKICGQMDVCIRDGNDIVILDYKTNREIKKKSYFNASKKKNLMMKYPLNDLMDCNYYHYTMQLSTYAYMVQQINPDLNIKALKLIHIDREGKWTIYDLDYKKDDVERMIKHYAKQLKTKEMLDRDKPYII